MGSLSEIRGLLLIQHAYVGIVPQRGVIRSEYIRIHEREIHIVQFHSPACTLLPGTSGDHSVIT